MTTPRGTVLIVGATSAIARGVAAGFARRGYDLVLAGRDQEEHARIAQDLAIRHGIQARTAEFDAVLYQGHQGFVDRVWDESGGLAGAVLCFGLLGDQAEATASPEAARRIVETNFLGAVTLLTPLANRFEQQRHGFLAALGSVAGDRGRQSNYVYGAAKGGLALFLQGLRQRLTRSGVTVTTIKPGFVDTRMTWGLPGMFLVADPAAVGETAVKAILAGQPIRYVPWFWRWIMMVIRMVPERVFMRVKM